MDDVRLERVRDRLRAGQHNLSELERRRSLAVSAGAAARERAPGRSRVEQLRVQLDEALTELDGLRAAMVTRGTIEQAKGMLMLRLDVDADTAFAHLRRLSNDTNTRLIEVAESVVRTRAGQATTTP